MLQIVKRTSVFVLIALATWVIVQAEAGDTPEGIEVPVEQLPYLEDLLFQSSRFNRPDDTRPVLEEHIIPILEADQPMLENDRFVLHFNEETTNIKVLDKTNDYVFATAIDDPDAGSFSPLLSSSVGFEYINLQTTSYTIRQNIGITEAEFELDTVVTENQLQLSFYVSGFCGRERCRENYDDYIAGNVTLEQMIIFGFTPIDIGFVLEITLTDTGILAHIPYSSIEENNADWVQLSSLILFPGMGATHMDDIPGYMVIPDGVGALIRYEDNQGRFRVPFEERFYGGNQGITSTRTSVTSYPLSMPVYGAIHGVRQHGFVAMIDSGDLNGRLLAYPNGASNVPYNLIFTKFDFKQTYRQSFSSDGSGGAMRIHHASREDVTVHYQFLAGDEADYVGMARRYQTFLVEKDHLTPQTSTEGPIPIHLQVLMADSQSTFLGTRLVPMTSLEGLRHMVDTFMAAGLTQQTVSLLGWNRGGYSGVLPTPVRFERSIGSKSDFETIITDMQEEGHRVLLVNNYHTATEATPNISFRNDVAERVNRFKMTRTCETCVYTSRHVLYPTTSVRLALDHFEDYQALGVEVLFENIGHRLFSYHQRVQHNRIDTFNHYDTLFQAYEDMGHYMMPHAYVYPYISDYFHTPIFNSQLAYFDDLVPFLPIVLRGHIQMFSQFLNFNSLGITPLLMLIDFGIYPSYVLTEERSSALRGTDVETLYATQFAQWDTQIIEEYTFVNAALSAVRGSSIVARTVPGPGLSHVTYDNGVQLLINYTSETQTIAGQEVEPLNVVVKEVP